MSIETLDLMLWAATIPLMPYALARRKYDLFYGLLIAFCMLGIGILDRFHILGLR